MCRIELISREPYKTEKHDCGRCDCMDSSKANKHSHTPFTGPRGALMQRCTTCGFETYR